MSIDEISALLLKVAEIAETAIPDDQTKIRLNLKKDGIRADLSKQWNGTSETWIITGFQEEDRKGVFTKEASDTIQAVIAQNSYALDHSSIRNQVGAVISSINNTTNSDIVNTDSKNLTQDERDALEYYVRFSLLLLDKFLFSFI